MSCEAPCFSHTRRHMLTLVLYKRSLRFCFLFLLSALRDRHQCLPPTKRPDYHLSSPPRRLLSLIQASPSLSLLISLPCPRHAVRLFPPSFHLHFLPSFPFPNLSAPFHPHIWNGSSASYWPSVGNRRSVQPIGCQANRVTLTHEAAQLLYHLHSRLRCISLVLTLPLLSSRVHATITFMLWSCLTGGSVSVNGVALSTLRVALTTTAGAGIKSKPFATHLQTFYPNVWVESLWCCFFFKERRRKAVSPPPMIHPTSIISFSCLCAIEFLFFCIRKLSVCLHCSITTHHASNLCFSRRQIWPFRSGKCHLLSCTEEIWKHEIKAFKTYFNCRQA